MKSCLKPSGGSRLTRDIVDRPQESRLGSRASQKPCPTRTTMQWSPDVSQSRFDEHYFFIRFHPDVSLIFLCSELSVHQKQIQKFIFINYSGAESLQEFHGKAIALDISDHHAPFPSIFIMHEFRVRGFHPLHPSPQMCPTSLQVNCRLA